MVRSTLLLGAAAAVAAAGWFAVSAPTPDAAVAAAPDAGVAAQYAAPATGGTVRAVAEALGHRHDVRIVFDPAVRADGPAPAVATGTLAGLLLESMLREVLAGHELVFHYGPDARDGLDRLKAVWVFAPQTPLDERVAAIATAQVPSPAAVPSATTAPPVPAAPIEPAEPAEADAALVPLDELRRRAEADPSESARLQALDALAAHPEADADELIVLLDRLALDASPLLAEQARALREARTTPADASLVPEPID